MKRLPIIIGLILLVSSVSGALTITNTTDGIYHIVTFTDVGNVNWDNPDNATSVDYLIVGGGAGGGSQAGGGGGGGGVLAGTLAISGHSIYVSVGGGGVGSGTPVVKGTNGQPSNLTTIQALGGGGGGSVSNTDGANGGTGGGVRSNTPTAVPGSGTVGQGYRGGYAPISTDGAGGGGGAGAVGNNGTQSAENYIGGDGGSGFLSSISGTEKMYGAGGAGGSNQAVGGGLGGNSTSGGSAHTHTVSTGGVGLAHYGGGGGGGGDSNAGGGGGAGTVILRYTLSGDALPIPSFTSNISSGWSPLHVQFNDTSITSPTGWNWSYQGISGGNTTQTWWSQLQNATGIFTTGNYTIKLNVTNSSGYNITAQNYWINVSEPNTYANFSGTPRNGFAGIEVTFTDETTGFLADNWTWDFGDGNTSSSQNPTHIYDYNGNFDVNLTIYNSTVGYDSELKDDYIIISDSGGLSGWNQQDILMEGIYTLTINFEDATTHAPIPTVLVIDSSGGNQTTTVGQFVGSYNYSVVITYISSDGYVSTSRSYVMDQDRSATVYLTRTPITSNSTQTQTTYYVPKTISIQFVDVYGNPLNGISVNAHYNSTTLPNGVQDLIDNYGMNDQAANNALNGTLIMSGMTDTYGSVVFTVLSTVMYDITATSGSNSNSYQLYPQNSLYRFKFIATAVAVDNLYTALYAAGNTKVWATEPDIGNVTFWWQYQDVTTKTTRIDFYLYDVDLDTMIFTTNVTSPVAGGIYQVNYTVPNTRGKNVRFWENYTRTI